jgi:hypothetical protein
MDTLICAGGTGARILKAVLHLCAAGLGPTRLRVFVIDPDATNGDGDQTRALVKRYQEMQRAFGAGSFGFFGTTLDLLRPDGDDQGLQVWSPVKQYQNFRTVLNYEALSPKQQDVVNLLYTPGELDMEMGIGYQGHPALGAAALALLPLFHQNVPLLRTFSCALKNDVASESSRVMIAGSVFGGTGASTIHPLVRYLRSSSLLENNANKLRVGAVALAPYFQFTSATDTNTSEKVKREAARSEDFPLASRSAADYYDHLRTTGDWDFDAMYWVGDDSPQQVKYAPGGQEQNNPGHFVDLLAAFACLDFFSNQTDGKSCWYCGPEVPEGSTQNILTWDDLPFRGKLLGKDRPAVVQRLELFQTIVVAHLGFYSLLLRDPDLSTKSYCVPWYADRFGSAQDSLTIGEHAKSLELLSDYWTSYYLPWWQQVHDASGRVRLFNTAAWNGAVVQLNRLGNVIYPDDTQHDLETVDQLFSNMVDVAKRTAPDGTSAASRYLTMLALASEQIVLSKSKNTVSA